MMPDADDQRLGVRGGRFDAVDAARGVAIVAMIGYHFGWDLSFFRLIVPDVGASPAWQWFARIIAGSFLILVGFGLVLAHGDTFRPKAFLRRLAMIGGAALAVTAATVVAFPDRYIFFGILHCIAVTSVLALPFLHAPMWVVSVVAALALVAPFVATVPAFDAPFLDASFLDAPILAFLGLGRHVPATNDYVPVLPWFGLVLAGVALGRLHARYQAARPETSWRAHGSIPRALVWAGRHSLPIYLTHQIILIGALSLVVAVVGRNPAAESADFRRDCQTSCLAAGREPAVCRAACGCVGDRLKGAGLWERAIAGRLRQDEEARVPDFARQCFEDLHAPLPLQRP